MKSLIVEKQFKAFITSIKEIETECKRIAVEVYGEKTLKTFTKCEIAGPDYQFDQISQGGVNRFYISYDAIFSESTIESLNIYILNPKKFIPFKD